MINIEIMENSVNTINGQITDRFKDLCPKIYQLFDKALYYSSDDEFDLPIDKSSYYYIKYNSDRGIDAGIIRIKKVKLFKTKENNHGIIRINIKEDGSYSVIYSIDDFCEIYKIVNTVSKYVESNFNEKIDRLNNILLGVEGLEDMLGVTNVN